MSYTFLDQQNFLMSIFYVFGMIGFLSVWLFYGQDVFAIMHQTGLWDLLDISLTIAQAFEPVTKNASIITEQIEPIKVAVESACQILSGDDLIKIADAPGRQAAEAMIEMYELGNSEGVYRITCQ